MYSNLQTIIESKNIPMERIATLLGVSSKTVYNKMQGNTEFTLSEVQKIRCVLPEYDFDFLFEEQ